MQPKLFKLMTCSSLVATMSMFTVPAAIAQVASTVTGVVSSSYDGSYLPGAVVSLQGTPYKSVVQSDGRFRLDGVAPGTYTLNVSYVGFDDSSTTVTVGASGGILNQSIALNPIQTMDTITVTGVRLGQSKELTAQKNAINIKNVISEEQINSFPDLNTAEVLQRVSGIGIQRDNGEGRFITMRGTSPQMTNVTVNGEQVAFSNAENRSVELDVISAAQLSGIEVTKVITPDMDANAIGGTVNLKTRSAFDQSGRVLNFTGGLGQNSIAEDLNSRVAGNFSDVFGAEENLGISIGANFARTARERHNSEHEWEQDGTTWQLADSRAQFSENTRDRYGVNGSIEYRLNEDNMFQLTGMYNYREDDQQRQELRVRLDRGDYISTTEVDDARLVNGLNRRVEEQKLTSLNLNTEHYFGNSTLEFLASTSNASTKKPDGQLKPEWQVRNVDVALSNLDGKSPLWTFTDFGRGEDMDLDVIDLKYENTTSRINTLQGDFEHPWQLGSDSGSFKMGAKYREVKKERSDVRTQWEWDGDGDSFDSDFFINDQDVILENGYNIGPRIDEDEFRDWFFANQNGDIALKAIRDDVNLGEPYNTKEKVKSIYGMTTQDYGNLTVLAGIRAEFTDIDASANHLVLGSVDWEDEITGDDGEIDLAQTAKNNISRSYNYIFPNLQFKYAFDLNSNFRLAYSRGISPPDFWASMPYNLTDISGDEVRENGVITDSDIEVSINQGNPELKPASSDNIDILAERYFAGIGVLSGGLFYKRLKDFNFTSTQYLDNYDDPFNLLDPAWDVTEVRLQTRLNGGGANLFGIELTWQQQFTFLEGWMSGFGVYANYTYTNASSIDLGSDVNRTDIAALPEQMQHIGNFALTYDKGRLTSRLAWNYSGKWIEEVGGTKDEDIWRDAANTLDLSASYKFTDNWKVFFQANNLTDEDKYSYWGSRSRSRQHSITGRSYDLGFKWTY